MNLSTILKYRSAENLNFKEDTLITNLFLARKIQRNKIYQLFLEKYKCDYLNDGSIPNNSISFVPLMLAVYRSLGQSQVDLWISGSRPNLELNDDDILKKLIYDGVVNGKITDYDKVINIMNDYDIPQDNLIFSINEDSKEYPLNCVQFDNVKVIYRLPSEGVLNMLLNVMLDFSLPIIVLNEVYILGNRKSVAFKSFVLSKFCQSEQIHMYASSSKAYDYVIQDAYVNLIEWTINNQFASIQDRYEMLSSMRGLFRSNLIQCLEAGSYKRVYLPISIEKYTNLFQELCSCVQIMINYLNSKNGQPPFDIKPYYLDFDQAINECNRLKVNEGYVKNRVLTFYHLNKKLSSFITQIHPDILIGLFNLSWHLQILNLEQLYYVGSPVYSFVNLCLNKTIMLKPLALKFLIKNGLDKILHDYKEEGFILFHQLEALFGYRNSHMILKELEDDFKTWVEGDQAKFSEPQGQFIEKWAFEYFNSINYQGNKIGDILLRNCKKFKDFSDLIGNTIKYLMAPGVVDGDVFKAPLEGSKKKRTVSKTTYFNLFKDPEEYIQEQNHQLAKNKVIIKKEEYIKQRIVINTTLNSFAPLSKINKFIMTSTNGSGNMFVSMTKFQKSQIYARLERFLLYNKHVHKRYLFLPLDYSSYDHTITLGFIDAAIEQLSKYCGYEEEVRVLLDQFHYYLYKEKIYFHELKDSKYNDSVYKFGMLSGWKITSSCESLGNAIISYGVIHELGYHLADLLTMGDDLVIVLDIPDLNRDQQLEVLTRVCQAYEELGFKMNIPKNSVGYEFAEFLRVTYYPGLVIGYPARILPSLFLLKPGRDEICFGIVEFKTVLKKICKRYGSSSRLLEIAKEVTKNYQRKDIRRNAYRFMINPRGYRIKFKKKINFYYKVNIYTTPIFKRYMKIFGNCHEFKTTIANYLKDNVAADVITYNTLIEEKDYIETASVDELNRVRQLASEFISSKNKSFIPGFQYKLRIPEYHLSECIAHVLKEHKASFTQAKAILKTINHNMLAMKMISSSEYDDNINCIILAADKRDIFSSLSTDKILVDDVYCPSTIVSQIKLKFSKFLRVKMQGILTNKDRLLFNKILSKDNSPMMKYVLGTIFSDYGEMKLHNFLFLIGIMAD